MTRVRDPARPRPSGGLWVEPRGSEDEKETFKFPSKLALTKASGDKFISVHWSRAKNIGQIICDLKRRGRKTLWYFEWSHDVRLGVVPRQPGISYLFRFTFTSNKIHQNPRATTFHSITGGCSNKPSSFVILSLSFDLWFHFFPINVLIRANYFNFLIFFNIYLKCFNLKT